MRDSLCPREICRFGHSNGAPWQALLLRGDSAVAQAALAQCGAGTLPGDAAAAAAAVAAVARVAAAAAGPWVEVLANQGP